MIAAFSRAIAVDRRSEPVGVVEVDVGDRCDPSIPGVGGVEPAAEADLDQGQVDLHLGEPAEGDRGQELELGRLARAAPAHSAGRVEDLADESGEGGGVDEPAVDLEPLPIADEMGLGGLGDAQAGGSQCRTGQGEHAALAVRPGNQRPAELELRIADLAEERPRPTQPETDPEATAFLEGPERLLVAEGAHVTPWTARPRRRRTG